MDSGMKGENLDMGRKALTAIGLVLMLCSAALAELPINGGFETGVIDPWAQGGDGVIFSTSTVYSHSGSYSAVGVATTNPEAGPLGSITQTGITLEPNKLYLVAFWCRNQGSNWTGAWDLDHNIADITFYEESGTGARTYHSIVAMSNSVPNWRRYTVAFTSAPDTVSGTFYVNCHLEDANPASPSQFIYLDDVQVQEIPYSVPLNGDFELGGIDCWQQTAFQSLFDVTTIGVHAGSFSAVAVANADPMAGSLGTIQQLNVPLAPNKLYLASFWLRTEGSNWAGMWDLSHNILHCGIQELTSTGAATVHNMAVVCSAVPNWHKYTVAFTSRADTANGMIFLSTHLQDSDPANPTQKLFIDDFKVQEILPGTPLNGDFELGGVDCWNQVGAEAIWDGNTANPYGGLYSAVAYASPSVTTGAGAITQSDMLISPNTEYQLSFYYRTEGDRWTGAWDEDHNYVDVQVHERSADGTTTAYHQMPGGITTESAGWKRVVYKFTTLSDTVTGYMHFNAHIRDLDPANPTQKLFIDNVVLGPIGYVEYTSIGAMKAAGEGANVKISSSVTRAWDDRYFFIESADRSSAILVVNELYGDFPYPGDIIDVQGQLVMRDGRLVLQTTAEPLVSAYGDPLAPLGANLVSALRPGLSMDALLVRVCGRVTAEDSLAADPYFVLDDGSGPVTVYTRGMLYPTPVVGEYMVINANLIKRGGVTCLEILSQDDVVQEYL